MLKILFVVGHCKWHFEPSLAVCASSDRYMPILGRKWMPLHALALFWQKTMTWLKWPAQAVCLTFVQVYAIIVFVVYCQLFMFLTPFFWVNFHFYLVICWTLSLRIEIYHHISVIFVFEYGQNLYYELNLLPQINNHSSFSLQNSVFNHHSKYTEIGDINVTIALHIPCFNRVWGEKSKRAQLCRLKVWGKPSPSSRVPPPPAPFLPIFVMSSNIGSTAQGPIGRHVYR